MAQLGVKCSRGKIKHNECRRCSLKSLHPCSLPPDLLELFRQENDQEPSHEAFTPSRLLSCDRQSALMSVHDYYQDVDEYWPIVRGHMVHSLMEGSTYPGAKIAVREVRFETPIETKYGQMLFLGKPDLIVVSNRNIEGDSEHWQVKIVDYKSTGEIGHDLTAPKKSHMMQVNMYAWLASRCLVPYALENFGGIGTDITVEVEELEIVYADMKKVRRFTSAGYLKGKGKLLDRRTKEKEELDLEPIVLLPLDVTEQWIRHHIEQKIEAKEKLPPPYDDPDMIKSYCLRCPVSDVCSDLARRGV